MNARVGLPTVPAAPEAPSASRERSAAGLSLLDRATLAAVVLLVIVVSIPRLRDMAVRANEHDARRSLLWLGSWVQGAELAPGGLVDALHQREDADRRLPDARVLAGTLVHHGYLFRLGRDPEGRAVLMAWPLERARTGHDCYLARDGELFRHRQPDHDRACDWSGVEHAPVAFESASEVWTPLEPVPLDR